MSSRRMVSHNGIRQSDQGGLGGGYGRMSDGSSYAGGSPGAYQPGGPGTKLPRSGKPSYTPGRGEMPDFGPGSEAPKKGKRLGSVRDRMPQPGPGAGIPGQEGRGGVASRRFSDHAHKYS